MMGFKQIAGTLAQSLPALGDQVAEMLEEEKKQTKLLEGIARVMEEHFKESS